ncbi:amino acid adenylation domain-containing protein [Amycolatopsis sp. NPDC021455]|uniref:non-ribosomal peptide synthetase/type I polyketide synthase n=1 Tax=Amycolatopsis sp. NPDC021455 TaxID=3154901 RepID=UPI00340E99D1
MQRSDRDIAVIGIACRYPAADGPDQFWATVTSGTDVVRSFTDDELLADGADPASIADPGYVRSGVVLDGIAEFDAEFFGMSRREAEVLDPQHRLFLECCWHAMEDAGQAPGSAGRRAGVFAGARSSVYLTENLSSAPELLRAVGDYQVALSTDKDYLAGRVAYKLDLRGPAVSVNTACSTSLVAVHMAKQSLLLGECDVALAGGAAIEPAQRRGYSYVEGGTLSPDGHCRPFDRNARGTIAASGVGVVVLKRLADALRDGDPVRAVIRGSAINNDGAAKVGFTAPGVDGQVDVITRALADAGVPPRSIGYVEAHGTGTPLGDPIEVSALTKAFRAGTEDTGFCVLGSVKGTFGHADAAAGVAGLIKAVLALQHGILPGNPNLAEPSPRIRLAKSPFRLNTSTVDWTADGGPRRAGVSSFGMGGTNAHVILEEAPPRPPDADRTGPALLALSAATPRALTDLAESLVTHLERHPGDLAGIEATLHRGRARLTHRRVVTGAGPAELVAALREPAPPVEGTDRPVAFVFPGQGSQYAGMGAGLYRDEPVFRDVVDECAAALRPHLGLDLRDVLHGSESADGGALDRTALTQPALFVTEYALARTLLDRGLTPAAMAGHSIGEYVAACLAGVFTLPDALGLVATRGRLVQSLPPGAMLAVELAEKDAIELLRPDVAIAAVNGPRSCVLSGPPSAVREIEADLRARDVACRVLRTSHAFHSGMLDPVLAEFTEAVAAVPLAEPGLRYLSNVTGTWVTAKQATDPHYWARHLREPVRFADSAAELARAGLVVAETGPGHTLTTLVRRGEGTAVPLMRRAADATGDLPALLSGVGRVWAHGGRVDLARFTGSDRHPMVSLPGYPFQRQRYWIEAGRSHSTVDIKPAAGETLTDDQARIAAVWTELLGVDDIGPGDDFFGLGGDSLLATRLVARLSSRFGLTVPLDAVFATPTLRGLTDAATKTRTTAGPAAEPVPVRPSELPATAVQRRMWFLDHAHDHPAAYVIATAAELRGPLDVAALRTALAEVVARHESLRTVFSAPEGRPLQVIRAEVPVALPVTEAHPADLDDLLQAAARTPFDLAEGPLFRFSLFRLAAEHHVLGLCVHHIVADSWSFGVLFDELGACYRALRAGEPSPLTSPAVQYADVVTDVIAEADLAYWRENLAGATGTVDLPTTGPRPPVQTFDGRLARRVLGADLTGRVNAVARDHDATLYMVLLAALQALLHRYSGQQDICVGSPVAGRTKADQERVVGCLLNTLVLRTSLDRELSFADLLTRVRSTALGAFAHQGAPFQQVVEALKLPKDPSRNPLFQVMFNLLNTRGADLALDGLTVAEHPVHPGGAQVDLGLTVHQRDGALVCELEYNTDLFDAAAAERTLGHFEQLLHAVTADPGTAIGAAPLLTPAEQAQLAEWSGTGTPVAPPSGGIHDLVAAQAARTPDAPAVTFGGTSLTYQELLTRADALAARLRDHGVGPDTLVAVAVERAELLPVALLAVLRAGGAYVPLDAAYPRQRQQFILDDSGAAVLLTERALADRYAGQDLTVLLADEPAGPQPAATAGTAASPHDLAYVLYTSGSTGRPKGVRVEHGSVVNFLRGMRERLGTGPADTLVAVTTYAFDISVLELFLPLISGGRVVLASRDVAHDPADLAALLERENATVMQATPATWQLLVTDGWTGRPGLTALCGGEALPVALAEQLTGRVRVLHNMYGPTEATIWATAAEVVPGVPITIGRPLPGVTAHLLDPGGQPVPVGVPGELHLGGACLARDYLGRPEITAERFVPDPFAADPDARLYKTGDLARHRADGTLEFLGRNDTQVKVRGHRIELGEIETVLGRHDAVRDAVAVVREDGGDKAIVGYVTLHDGAAAPSTTDWRAHLRTVLPDYMLPSAFVVLEAFPLTPNGKVDRTALPAPRRTVAETRTAPRTAFEADLATRWCELLGLPGIGIDDDFFAMGGDSFKAVRAVRDLGVPATVMDLFTHPTIRQFAEHVAGPGTGTTTEQKLLLRLTPARPATVNLVCVPLAAGGALTYRELAAAVPDHIALYAIQPPGHDVSNPGEPALGFDELVERCAAEVEALAGPVVLYGHCMGGAQTIALARKLEDDGADLLRVVIGGHFPAPRMPGRFSRTLRAMMPLRRTTSKRRALEFLRATGLFNEVTDAAEQDFLMRIFLDDTQQGEDFYTDAFHGDGFRKLAAPVVCVVGDGDRVTELYQERVAEWTHFSDAVSLHVIPRAGHYFHKHQAGQLASFIVAGEGAPVTPPPPADMRAFLLVALGQLVSLIGSGLTTFTLGVFVYQRTGSVSLFGLISVLTLLPAVALAPVTGAIADRWDRRKIMLGADALSAVSSIGLVTLLWTGSLQLWQVYPLVGLGAIAVAFQQPAYRAAVTQLVPKRYYGRANGLAQLGSAAGTVLAPLLGGGLAVLVGLTGVVVIDVVTFGFALLTLVLVRFPDRMFNRLEEPFTRELTGGWRYLVRRPGLLAIILATTALNFTLAMVEVIATPLTLSMGAVSTLGLVMAAGGLGLLGGSVLTSLWGGFRRRTTGILGSFAVIGAFMVVLGLVPNPVFPAVGLFGIGLASAVLNAHWGSIVQAKVGLELQGRVFAANLMVSWLMVPAGFALAGPLTDGVFEPLAAAAGMPGRGMGWLAVGAGIVSLALAAGAWRYRRLRLLEDELPDAIPDPVVLKDKDAIQAKATA